MSYTCAVSEFDGIDPDVLKLIQAIRFGDLGIEASAANLRVALLNGAEVDDVVARRDLAATCTADLFAFALARLDP